MNGTASGYGECCRLVIEHAYHGEREWTGWRAFATAATRDFLERERLLVRQAPGALAVFAPGGQATGIVEFAIAPGDPRFGGYTLPQAPPGQVLVADGGRAAREASGAWRLHPDACIGAESLAPADGAPARGPLPAPLLVRIDLARTPGRCLVRLDAASTYWKYYLQGMLAERDVAIVDADGQVAFARTDAVLAGGRKAAVFLSDRAIALRERPGQRFQLCERAPFGDKVLMKRLPVAGAGGLTRVPGGEEAVLVSEIFVNL